MKYFIVTSALLNLMVCFFLSFSETDRESFALSLWESTHSETIATLMDPGSPQLAFTLAEYYFNHGSYDVKKAETYYTRAIELNPNFFEAYYQRGRIRFINGQFEQALADINTVLRINPDFSKAYYMYGLINGYDGNMQQAEDGFSEFIKRDSFNWAGYNDLAWIYFKQGRYEKTLVTAAAGLTQAPTNPWLNNIYGAALINLGQKDKARQAFETALKSVEHMSPDDWGQAYPGNNPTLYPTGIKETQSVIHHNLLLTNSANP